MRPERTTVDKAFPDDARATGPCAGSSTCQPGRRDDEEQGRKREVHAA